MYERAMGKETKCAGMGDSGRGQGSVLEGSVGVVCETRVTQPGRVFGILKI